MKKLFSLFSVSAVAMLLLSTSALALSHTVKSGDTMWKLAVKYQVGTSEIIQANPQFFKSRFLSTTRNVLNSDRNVVFRLQ